MGKRSAALLLAIWSLHQLATSAQHLVDDSRMVTVRVAVTGAGPDDRMYGLPHAIEARLALINGSGMSALTVNERAVRAGVTAAVSPAPADPIRVDWSPEVFLANSSTGTPSTGAQTLALAAGGSVHWVLRLSREDGESFPEGLYKIIIALNGIGSALRYENGTPWAGEVIGDGGAFIRDLRVQLPTDREEERNGHLVDASGAVQRGDHSAALAAYLKAAAADPDSQIIASRVALSLLILKRYPEAIAAYEALVSHIGLGELDTARDLAHAYAGAGDLGNARRVLRPIGLTRGPSECRVDDDSFAATVEG
jgi:hypothetical protein